MSTSSLLWVLAAALVVTLGAELWRLHRRRLAALECQLREAEDSRLELIDETLALRQKLERSDLSNSAGRRNEDAAAQDLAVRREALERVLAAAPAAPLAAWQDTQPMSVPPDSGMFLPTAPAELPADTRR